MCDHDHSPTCNRSIAIEDAAAHGHDAAAWARGGCRADTAAAAGGTACLLGSTPV